MHNTIPEWSGLWVETADGQQGMISVVYADERLHKPPEGWTLVDVIQDETEGSETYVYRRTE